MLDVQKLKGKIVEKGKSVETVSADLGINPATFYRKLKNNSFEIREADKLIEILALTGEEASAIFLKVLTFLPEYDARRHTPSMIYSTRR